MFILIITVLLEIILISLLLKINKTKKNIWQKISFLYNKLYKILILYYYYNYNDSLKEEILDFYNKVVLKKDIIEKNKQWKNFEEFIIKYFERKEVYNIIDDINWSIERQYNVLNKWIYNIIYSMIIIIVFWFIIQYILN